MRGLRRRLTATGFSKRSVLGLFSEKQAQNRTSTFCQPINYRQQKPFSDLSKKGFWGKKKLLGF